MFSKKAVVVFLIFLMLLMVVQSPTLQFYGLSELRATISGNPTDRHAFQPVHNMTIIEVNKVVDGETRKYLAYDSDQAGSQIRLYYTNDLDGIWSSYSGNPILGISVNNYRWPSVTYVNGVFQMLLTDRTNGYLERWTSIDGIHFTFAENVKSGGSEWKNPFIWFNSNDGKWYLYSHDSSGVTEYIKVRKATNIESLRTATDTIVLSENFPFGAASVMYYDNEYWMLTEILKDEVWNILAYYSNSPTSNFTECANSPILTNNEACPILLLNPTETKAYLFTNKYFGGTWYQDTREVSLIFGNNRMCLAH